MKEFAKPMVTIELAEYNQLKKEDVEIYQKALSIIFTTVATSELFLRPSLSREDNARSITREMIEALKRKDIYSDSIDDNKIALSRISEIKP